jgi:hypothetical protein
MIDVNRGHPHHCDNTEEHRMGRRLREKHFASSIVETLIGKSGFNIGTLA